MERRCQGVGLPAMWSWQWRARGQACRPRRAWLRWSWPECWGAICPTRIQVHHREEMHLSRAAVARGVPTPTPQRRVADAGALLAALAFAAHSSLCSRPYVLIHPRFASLLPSCPPRISCPKLLPVQFALKSPPAISRPQPLVPTPDCFSTLVCASTPNINLVFSRHPGFLLLSTSSP